MQDSTPRTEPRFAWWHTLVVVIGAVIGATFLAAILLAIVYGLPEDGVYPTAATFWIVLPTQALFQYLALRWVSVRWGTGSFKDDFAFEIAARDVVWIFAGPLALYVLGIVGLAYRALLGITEDNPQSILDAVQEVRTTSAVIPLVIGTVVLAPVLEELQFRGLLYRTAVDKGLSPAMTAGITAVAFALIHAVDPELWSKSGSATLLTLFLFGLVLAEIRRRTGSLGAVIFAHSGFNLTTVVFLLFFPEAAGAA